MKCGFPIIRIIQIPPVRASLVIFLWIHLGIEGWSHLSHGVTEISPQEPQMSCHMCQPSTNTSWWYHQQSFPPLFHQINNGTNST